jgi:hypothetical protein
LPALGIVATVQGVIKTMSHIDQPPAVPGAMIGSALTGTFLGVLLAYDLVGPFACRLKRVVEEDAQYFQVIRAVLVTHLHANAPQVSVESGRKMVLNEHMPSFQELEEAVQTVQIGYAGRRSAPHGYALPKRALFRGHLYWGRGMVFRNHIGLGSVTGAADNFNQTACTASDHQTEAMQLDNGSDQAEPKAEPLAAPLGTTTFV